MRQATLDDVCESIDTLIEAVTRMHTDLAQKLEAVESAVWNTMPT